MGTHAFCFIETKDLKDMGFKLGEIADLKDAIKSYHVVFFFLLILHALPVQN
jgi:hypothetical protein